MADIVFDADWFRGCPPTPVCRAAPPAARPAVERVVAKRRLGGGQLLVVGADGTLLCPRNPYGFDPNPGDPLLVYAEADHTTAAPPAGMRIAAPGPSPLAYMQVGRFTLDPVATALERAAGGDELVGTFEGFPARLHRGAVRGTGPVAALGTVRDVTAWAKWIEADGTVRVSQFPARGQIEKLAGDPTTASAVFFALARSALAGGTLHVPVVAAAPGAVLVRWLGRDVAVYAPHLCWEREVDIERRFRPGTSLDVQVRGVDWEFGHILLSLKGFDLAPWNALKARFPVGTRLSDAVFGGYCPRGGLLQVDAPVRAEFLVPNGELGWGNQYIRGRAVPGERVPDAVVIGHDDTALTVLVSLRRGTPSPWSAEAYAGARPGDVVQARAMPLHFWNEFAFHDAARAVPVAVADDTLAYLETGGTGGLLPETPFPVRVTAVFPGERTIIVAPAEPVQGDTPGAGLHPGAVVEGVVRERVKGGLRVEVEGVSAFLPGSQLDVRPVRDFDAWVGRPVRVEVIKTDPVRRNVVVSRRSLLEAERAKRRAELTASLTPGMRVSGVVKNVAPYGVFVDLGGLDGLVHNTDLAWSKAEARVYQPGDPVEAVVLRFDAEKQHLSLGIKQLVRDPWPEAAARVAVGDRMTVRVTGTNDAGAFVECEPGVEGFVPLDELTWDHRNRHPARVVQVGDMLSAVVTGVAAAERCIELSVRRAGTDPWLGVRERWPSGTEAVGRVVGVADFGVFVSIVPGVDGLAHLSDIRPAVTHDLLRAIFEPGASVTVRVLYVDEAQRRLGLAVDLAGVPAVFGRAAADAGGVARAQDAWALRAGPEPAPRAPAHDADAAVLAALDGWLESQGFRVHGVASILARIADPSVASGVPRPVLDALRAAGTPAEAERLVLSWLWRLVFANRLFPGDGDRPPRLLHRSAMGAAVEAGADPNGRLARDDLQRAGFSHRGAETALETLLGWGLLKPTAGGAFELDPDRRDLGAWFLERSGAAAALASFFFHGGTPGDLPHWIDPALPPPDETVGEAVERLVDAGVVAVHEGRPVHRGFVRRLAARIDAKVRALGDQPAARIAVLVNGDAVVEAVLMEELGRMGIRRRVTGGVLVFTIE